MAVFSSSDQLHRVMEDLWTAIKNDPEMSAPLVSSGLIVQFIYREPDGRLTVDCSSGNEMVISTGESDKKPNVEMFMKSDVAHEFWMGKVNVPMALLQGRIVAKGPVQQALKLLPAIKPAYQVYPEIARQHDVK